MALILLATAALAQSPADSRIATGLNAISSKNLRADLTFLASDALEGRMSLQKGSEIAIQFSRRIRQGGAQAAGRQFVSSAGRIDRIPA